MTPIDPLEYHQQIAKQHIFTKVYPTFRPDALLLIESSTFQNYLRKMETCVGFSIDSLDDLLKAIQSRINYFHELGCRLSDYGLEQIYAADFTESDRRYCIQKTFKQ